MESRPVKFSFFIIMGLITSLLFPSLTLAFERAERITDREIVERLTRVETKLDSIEIRIDSVDDQTKQLREDMNTQIKQLREDMNAQFDRLVNIMVMIVLAFAGIVAATIGFAIWDRRTMIRPFETKVKGIEDEIAENRSKLHSLIETFRTLSKTDEKVAEVLKKFNLL